MEAVANKIHRQVLALPEPLQVEVLDFVEFLLSRLESETLEETQTIENRDWSKLSLAMAMRGMEDEDIPEYTIADLKESF
ncbi:MAG: DUF2281 domain-containing protein [Anaerolineae bacterium]|nr:DUF2281 domain-containing protein [Anaerolineae bacterium]